MGFYGDSEAEDTDSTWSSNTQMTLNDADSHTELNSFTLPSNISWRDASAKAVSQIRLYLSNNTREVTFLEHERDVKILGRNSTRNNNLE